jgi:hypothetical protein
MALSRPAPFSLEKVKRELQLFEEENILTSAVAGTGRTLLIKKIVGGLVSKSA